MNSLSLKSLGTLGLHEFLKHRVLNDTLRFKHVNNKKYTFLTQRYFEDTCVRDIFLRMSTLQKIMQHLCPNIFSTIIVRINFRYPKIFLKNLILEMIYRYACDRKIGRNHLHG